MAKDDKLTAAEVAAIHEHLDRHLAGQRKALTKWQAAKRVNYHPSIDTNIRYCRWSIKLIGMLKATATQRTKASDARKRNSRRAG